MKKTDMTDYTFLKKLHSGECSYGIMTFEFFTPGTPQILAASGAEFFIVDTEHSGAGLETLKLQMAAARGLNLYPIVRVAGTHYHLVATALDAGAKGIMVPAVSSREQAEQIALWCRYRPEGRRGVGLGLAHDDYTPGDPVDKMRALNAERVVVAQIETAEGLENVEAIMEVPGIDVGWLGHFDLTNSLGIPGQFEHPKFLEAVECIAAACEQHGKVAGFLDLDPERICLLRDKGFRLLGYGHDVGVFQAGLRQGFAQIKQG